MRHSYGFARQAPGFLFRAHQQTEPPYAQKFGVFRDGTPLRRRIPAKLVHGHLVDSVRCHVDHPVSMRGRDLAASDVHHDMRGQLRIPVEQQVAGFGIGQVARDQHRCALVQYGYLLRARVPVDGRHHRIDRQLQSLRPGEIVRSQCVPEGPPDQGVSVRYLRQRFARVIARFREEGEPAPERRSVSCRKAGKRIGGSDRDP